MAHVRFYTVEKEFDGRFMLVSYMNDTVEVDVTCSAEALVPFVAKYVKKRTPYVGYSSDIDPNYFYTIPSPYTRESSRKRALALWSVGMVREYLAESRKMDLK